MPVEIREIVIKTEVRDQRLTNHSKYDTMHWQELRKQLLSDCSKMIARKMKAKKSKR